MSLFPSLTHTHTGLLQVLLPLLLALAALHGHPEQPPAAHAQPEEPRLQLERRPEERSAGPERRRVGRCEVAAAATEGARVPDVPRHGGHRGTAPGGGGDDITREKCSLFCTCYIFAVQWLCTVSLLEEGGGRGALHTYAFFFFSEGKMASADG